MVRDMVQDDPSTLVCILIDEVESLASSRNNSSSGDPSDAMRAVNSLLTSLDRLRSFPNVLVLATTNLTASVDDAFVDRVDLKLHIGMPILKARLTWCGPKKRFVTPKTRPPSSNVCSGRSDRGASLPLLI